MSKYVQGTSTVGSIAKIKCLKCGYLGSNTTLYYDSAKGELFARCDRCGQRIR